MKPGTQSRMVRRRPKSRGQSLSTIVILGSFAVGTFIVMHNIHIMMHLHHNHDVVLNDMPELSGPSMKNIKSFHTFVVWTYPEFPDNTDDLAADEILLCSYPPCSSVPSERLNLRELTRDTTYEDFILDHALHKVDKRRSYLPHVQSIALLSLVIKHPDKCARTLGDSRTICAQDLPTYAAYDPTKSTAVAPFRPANVPTGLNFGVLSYEKRVKLVKKANVEDEVQSLVAAQFLPFVSGFIDRDTGLPDAPGYLLANAQYTSFVKLPQSVRGIWKVTFPSIQVLLDGKTAMEKHSQLLNAGPPIGAETIDTLKFLQEKDIQSYLALSFTLMWDTGRRIHPENRTSTVIIDVPSSVLPASVKQDAMTLPITLKDHKHLSRLNYAYGMLETFASAKVVITSRIQTAMTATAIGTSVIFCGSKDDLERNGIDDMFYVYESGQKWNYTLDDLPLKPGVHRADRARASFWNVLKQRSPFYSNTATLYGMVPLRRLGRSLSNDEPLHNLFHFIFTTSPDTLTWREKRSIEYVFHHHPNAKVIVHSNSLPEVGSILDVFVETGYDLSIQTYDLAEMLRKTISDTGLVNTFVAKLSEFLTGPHWYSHETDILRYMLLWHHGGVYLDTDMYLIKPLLTTKMRNVVAYQDPKHEWASGAVMIFEKQHDMLHAALEWTLGHYEAEREGWPILGSGLVTLMHHEQKYQNTFEVMDDASFYPIDWESIDTCFKESLDDMDLSNTFGVHLNTKITSHYTHTTQGTFCNKLLHEFCIFCDEIHTVKRVDPGPEHGNQTATSPETTTDDEGSSLFSRFVPGFFGDSKKKSPPRADKRVYPVPEHGKQTATSPERTPDEGLSLFSRFVSGFFGDSKKKRPLRVINKPPPRPERKALPPVYMEFVRRKD